MKGKKNKKKKIAKIILGILCVLIAVGAAAVGGLYYWVSSTGSPIPIPGLDAIGTEEHTDDGTPITVSGDGRREGVFTMFIGATDEEEVRTDSMMVMTFDTVNHDVQVMNIPRDTIVDTKRTGSGKKINSAYGEGMDELYDDLEGVIGFKPDKYLVANFDGIADIVDVLGGVDYEVPFDMSYHDPKQNLSIEFKKGMQHMNGKQVVEFLRWRHNDDGEGYTDGDVGRVEKLQTFLVTLAKKVMTPANIIKIPTLASTVFDNVETDLTSAQMLWLGMQAVNVDMDTGVHMNTLAGDSARISMGESIWFYILDKDLVVHQVNQTINPYEYALTEDKFDIVTPDTLGRYSSNWNDEREYRYSMYQKSDAVENMQQELENANQTAVHAIRSTAENTQKCAQSSTAQMQTN